MGITKQGYYPVGHAALLLIDYRNSEILYFDFGRYHTPDGFGRVRDSESDPELKIDIKANIVNGTITNIKEILLKIDKNKSTHGEGKLISSITTNIDFDLSYQKAKTMQFEEEIAYGPFKRGGSNCSRFVASVYRAGCSHSFFQKNRILFSYLYCKTPTSNIITTHSGSNVYIVSDGRCNLEKSMISVLLNNYKEENYLSIVFNSTTDNQIPTGAQVLKGVGCSAWFKIDATDQKHLFHVRRYSENGKIEIDAIYQLDTLGFDIDLPYSLDYISNGIQCRVFQNGIRFTMQNIKYLPSTIVTPIVKPTYKNIIGRLKYRFVK